MRVGGEWAYACPLIGLANRGIAGHGADTGRAADLVMAAFATLDFPLTEVEVFRTDRGGGFDNARIDGCSTCSTSKDRRRGRATPTTTPWSNPQQAPEEGAHIPEPLHQPGTTTLDPDDYVWWSDNQRLHSTLGYRSPNEFTEQGLVL